MDYYTHPTHRLENRFLAVDYLAQAGPRLVRLLPAGSDQNLLAELPDMTQATPYGEYHFFGGHRLWHSPESMPRSYLPDNEGLQVEHLQDGSVRLTQPVEAGSGLQKAMQLHLAPDAPLLTIQHSLTNAGLWPVECAPWAITQLKLGGLAILPQQASVPAPQLLPDRTMTIWNYTRLQDPRLHLGDDFILLEAASRLPPCKIGVPDPQGWLAYLIDEVLFVKRFTHLPDLSHPDSSCDTEVYCNDRFIELETLGALLVMQPDQTVTHTETWQLYTGVKFLPTLDGVRAMVKALGL
jgi:hypothetical protein